jgi:hypothetical protein
VKLPPAVRVGGFALVGAALLSIPAHVYRVDSLVVSCAAFPAWPLRFACAAVYALAIALLTWSWLRSLEAELSLGQVLGVGALIHALAWLAPPFLSGDTLFYTAVGRALANGAGAHHPLGEGLAGDPLLSMLPANWRVGGSAYFVGFDTLARVVASLPGGPRVAMRAFQLLGLLCMVGTAALVGRAFDAPREQARAAALVLWSPLAVIEATQSGHNDAFLALATGAFALALVRGRRWTSLLALAAAFLIKASAAVVFALEIGRRALAPARRLLTPRRVVVVGLALALAMVGAFFALERRYPALGSFGAIFGSPDDAWEHCTRSFECLPRAFLRYVLHRNRAAFVIGIVFRVLGGLWLLWCAARAAVSDSSPTTVLRWISTAVFVYYLLLHGYMQSWYLLTLLPLAAFADPVLLPAMKLFFVAAVAYYPLDLLIDCETNPVLVGGKEFFEAFITVPVPAVYLALCLRRRRAVA